MSSDAVFGVCRRVNLSNQRQRITLHSASMAGNEDDVRRLLDDGVDVLSTDSDGSTPLHSAAQSAQPSCAVARMLLDALMKTGKEIGDCPCDSAGNTPLHVAAGNVNATAEFISIVFDSQQHRKPNGERDTPFHVAAKSDNPATIVALLKILTASRRGCSIDELDEFRDPEDPTLIELSAIAGNADAVAMMIQNGADITHRLMHRLITESVRDPSKIDRLTRVYQVIVDNALHWRSVHEHEKFPVGDRLYFQLRMQTVMYLLTREDDSEVDDTRRRNILEHAIAVGAHEMLETIVNTENVFRFSDNPLERSFAPASDIELQYQGMWYVITNFVRSTESPEPFTRSADNDEGIENIKGRITTTANVRHDFDKIFKPRRPYLTSMVLDSSSRWRKSNILLSEPFRQLTVPFINFVQHVYILLAVIQFLYMTMFAVFCLPTACSLSERFRITLPSCNSSTSTNKSEEGLQTVEFPRHWWLLWPCLMFTGSAGYLILAFVRSIIDRLSSIRCKVASHAVSSKDLGDINQIFTVSSSSDSQNNANETVNLDEVHTDGSMSPSASLNSEGEDETDGNCITQRPSSIVITGNIFNTSTVNVFPASASSVSKVASATERHSANHHRDISVVFLTINLLPLIAFCIAVFLWYIESGISVTMQTYVETTSMVFLFGWTTSFVFFSGIKREFYLFSLVLREFIARDICYKFIPLFFFTVVAFSFSRYLLQLPSSHSQTSVVNSLYNMIMVAAAFEQTTDSEHNDRRPWLSKLVFTVYVYLTAVILLNVLIAMMNHRYDNAKLRAEREWRFRSVEIAMTIQESKLYKWIMRPFCRYQLPFCLFLRCSKRYVNDSQQFLIPVVRTKNRTTAVQSALYSTTGTQ